MEGWEIFKIRGIPLKIHSSWFIIFFLFTWSAQEQFSTLSVELINKSFSGPVFLPWLLGCLSSLLLFTSVLLHELGHSFVALREGVKVRSITLFFLGGFANVERECDTPMGTFRVAIAGPLVSFLLSLLFFFISNQIFQTNLLLKNLFLQLGTLNLIICMFNMLPGLPLDGGVVLKSLVWHFTGSQRKGTRVATRTGKFISIFAIAAGSFLSLATKSFFGLWLVLIGWFGLAASRSQNQVLIIQDHLKNIKVHNALSKRYRILEKDLPLRKISQINATSEDSDYLKEWILVVSEGRWIGYITEKPLKEIPIQNWDNYLLGDYAQPISDLPSISLKAELWQAVLAIERTNEDMLLVLSPAGLPVGTIDRVDIGTTLLRKMGLNLPSKLAELSRRQKTYPLGLALPQVVESMVSSGQISKKSGS